MYISIILFSMNYVVNKYESVCRCIVYVLIVNGIYSVYCIVSCVNDLCCVC